MNAVGWSWRDVGARRAFRSPRVGACTVVLLFALNWAANGHHYLNYQAGPVHFNAEVGRLARALLRDGAFADPFGPMPTGPSAHTPPAFPAIFAALVSVFGEGPGGWTAINAFGGAVLSLWIGLLPVVARRSGLSCAAGVVGAIVAIVASLHHFPEWDANYTALVLVLLALNGDGHVLRGLAPPSGRAALACTALWGLAFHLNATTLLLFTAWTVTALWRMLRANRPLEDREADAGVALSRRRLAYAVIVPLLSLAPWTARNWLTFGQPILLRGNLGLEIAASNNDCAWPGLLENLESGCFGRTHPDLSREQALRVRALGEPAYHAARLEEGLAWIRGHPGQFIRLTLQRAVLFWFPFVPTAPSMWSAGAPPRRAALIGIATAASILVLVRLGRAGLGLGCVLLVFPLTYYPVQFEDRYRYPVLWVTFILAGQAVVMLVRHGRSRRPRGLGRVHRLRPHSEHDALGAGDL